MELSDTLATCWIIKCVTGRRNFLPLKNASSTVVMVIKFIEGFSIKGYLRTIWRCVFDCNQYEQIKYEYIKQTRFSTGYMVISVSCDYTSLWWGPARPFLHGKLSEQILSL